MDDERLGCRALQNEKDKKAVFAFIEESPTYATLLMPQTWEQIEKFKGWWWAAVSIETQEIRAVACIEDVAANLYSTSRAATRALAESMLSKVRRTPSEKGKRHQLFGDARVLTDFWDIFADINRTVLFDGKRQLYGTSEPTEDSKPNLALSRAKPEDLRIIVEFGAEQVIEQWGIDPRRAGMQAHQDRCKRLIEDGRQLIVRSGGAPMLIAETIPKSGNMVMLDRVYVSRKFRIRKKLIGAALAGVARLMLQDASEVLFFADEEDELWSRAAALAGFEPKRLYRLVATRS